MDALVRLGETGQPVQLAQGGKQLPPAGQSLVNIALVAHVKDQPVFCCVEHPVDGHRQLHRPQIGGQVSAGLRDALDQKRPQLLTQLRQLAAAEFLEILRRVYLLQYHASSSSQRWNTCKNRPAQ